MGSYAKEAGHFLDSKVDKKVALGTAAVASTLVLLTYIYKKMSQRMGSAPPERYPISLQDQSKIDADTGERSSHLARKGRITKYMYEDTRSVYHCLLRGCRVSNNGPCLGTRGGPNNEYQWINYDEIRDRAQKIGSGLINKGLVPGDETFVGIFSNNRTEWVLCDHACAMYSLVSVPLYDTLGPDACTYIINQTSMAIVLVDKPEKAQALLNNIESTPSLKFIVVFESITNNNLESAEKHQIQVLSLTQLEDEGRHDIKDPIPPKPENTATICYTSGTTGPPKGVVLSHENMVSNIAAVLEHAGISLQPEDVYTSYLPLAHMMERTVQLGLIKHGSRIGFFRGDVKLLMEDILALRPTLFVTVPRLLNRIYDKVIQGTSASWIKNKLFTMAFNSKKGMLERGVVTQTSMWDYLVFGKIQKLLGGRVKYIVTGSAPISSTILDFLRICFGCTVIEGYGQTECNAACSLTLPYETVAGHVGAPIPCNRLKLVDVPEMDYFAKDDKGEVCIKGANVMKGYYKEPEKTAEALDEDGWLHTGDIGQWLPNGTLKIIDRKKHIFKLAQGEYIAPEKIENIYVRTPLVAQSFVDGSSLETFPVAIVIPDEEVIPKYAAKHGLPTSMQEFCQNDAAKELVLKEMVQIGKEAGLKGFEQVKNIYLHPELFSVQNQFLTPTFKAKRAVIRKHFKEQIENMYRQVKEASS